MNAYATYLFVIRMQFVQTQMEVTVVGVNPVSMAMVKPAWVRILCDCCMEDDHVTISRSYTYLSILSGILNRKR
jgi:hypothetical protein